MSDFTDVSLVGPGGRSGVFRIYPERCQVLFADLLAVGDGSLESLLNFLERRIRWDGGFVIVEPAMFFDRTVIKMQPPHMNEYTTLTGSRKQIIEALRDVFAANV